MLIRLTFTFCLLSTTCRVAAQDGDPGDPPPRDDPPATTTGTGAASGGTSTGVASTGSASTGGATRGGTPPAEGPAPPPYRPSAERGEEWKAEPFPGYRDELGSINTESTAATVLYSIAGALIVGGAFATTFAAALTDSSLSIFGGPAAFFSWFVLMPSLVLALFVFIPIGIGLDVDSGSRREALERRRREAVAVSGFGVSVRDDGGVLQLVGEF